MKKVSLLLFIHLFILPFLLVGQQPQFQDLSRFEGIVSMEDMHRTQTVHPIARRAMKQKEVAGTFKNATYTLAPNVKVLSEEEKDQLKMKHDGILDRSGLTTFEPDPNTIYLDDEGEFAFRAQSISENEMLVLKPKLSAIFEDFSIPEQEVPLTLANTVVAGPDIEIASSTDSEQNYLINFILENYKIAVDTAGQSGAFIILNGNISLTNPRIEAKYTKNDGYKITLKTEQRLNLKTNMNIKLKQEKKVLLWGSEAPIPDLGKCEIGIFAVVNIDGNVSLITEISQGFDLQLGVKGGTCWWVPTSFNNASGFSNFYEMDARLTLNAKSFAGLMCTANMKISGMKLLNVNFTSGLEAKGEIEELMVSADAGLRAKAGWKLLNRKKTLFDWYCSLYKYERPNFEGYSMVLHEACAYGDFVAGEIAKAEGTDTIPYQGDLQVYVSQSNSNEPVFYETQTNEDGIFIAKDVPLRKGDKVAIKLPGVPNLSPEMNVTIPFSEIKLYHVDYYAGVAEGSVASSKSKWYKMAASSSTNPEARRLNPGLVGTRRQIPAGVFKQDELLDKIEKFRNNLLEYKGAVEFITQRNAPSTLKPQTTRVRRTRRNATASKPKGNRGIVNPVNGNFTIKNLEFTPGQKVKARATIEGFTIESEWVEPEGLLVNEIETEGRRFSGSYNSTTVSADRSFVLVSPVRSDVRPGGNLRLMKGINFSESLPSSERVTVSDFPEAKNAVVYFDQTVPLRPLEGNPSSSVAETGAWSITYSIPLVDSDVFTCNKPFEFVSYTFKDQEIGYRYYLERCKGVNEKDLYDMFERIKIQRINIPIENIIPREEVPDISPSVGGGIR